MGTATAADAQLNGSWAPFTRCPVDSAPMLSADGRATTPQCVSSHSDSGSITLGSTKVTTGASDLQLGVVQNSDGTSTLVPPASGSIIADSAAVPGGLIGLMCPSDIPVITDICKQLDDSALNRITATIESVGTPSDFALTAGATTGKPIIAIPVRIRLQNPFLSDHCYIGSASDPIVLRPQNLTQPTFKIERFAADGTPDTAGTMSRIALTGSTQGDSSFAVPGASGCGLLGLIDLAVNAKTGLPSAAGQNSVTLNDTQTYLGGLFAPGTHYPDAGKVLAQNWHTAAG
ncbi:hypothetical protein [Streptomyces sp. CB01635]|uniref:hypothetical protein n=1 Tax=Streptomyces sp. NPDC000188 TaxID=3154245 RepID=UPI001F2F7C9F|nr:hypothetical protein [Streptomyces sp. CB01635]